MGGKVNRPSSLLLPFIKQHNGEYVRSATGLGRQCVDLVQLWWEAMGRPWVSGNASTLYGAAPCPPFVRVANRPYNAPVEGAVVVWHEWAPLAIGADGHCAVVVAASPRVLLTFDQDWPTGAPCRLTLHDYGGVVGWLT